MGTRARTGEGERGGVVGGSGAVRVAVAGGGERREGAEDEEREQKDGYVHRAFLFFRAEQVASS